MKEFEVYLNKLLSGNITLIGQFGSVQLAIQTAIRNAFKSPEVVRMFAKKENGALRSKLASCDQDLKLGKITLQVYNDMTGKYLTSFIHELILTHYLNLGEIVLALEKLGEELTPKEKEILEKRTKNMDGFTAASESIGSNIMRTATEDTKKYSK